MSKNAYKASFASDIFNNKPKPHAIERLHKRSLSKGKTDVFNEIQIKEEKQLKTHRGTKSQSDIFFQNSVKPKIDNSLNRNITNRSMVFANLQATDYRIKKDKIKNEYDPSPYYQDKDITPVKRKLYGLYSEKELNTSGVNILGRSMTVKGYIQQEEKSFEQLYKPPHPFKRRFLSRSERNSSNTSFREHSSATVNKISNMKSNIFNDDTKAVENDLNQTPNPKISYVTKEMTYIEPQVREHSKWSKQLKWNNPKNEILFKKDPQSQDEYDQLTAYQRKYNNLHGSIPSEQSLIKEYEPAKENIDSYIAKGYQYNDRQRKLYDNVSSGFPQNFYKESLRYASKSPLPSEHEYQIKESKGLQPMELQKMLEKKGMHVFNMQDDTSMIFGNTSYRFKIRENDQEEFNKTFGEVCQSMKKEKGIDIEPVQRIRVNRIKHNEIQLDSKRTFEIEEDKKKEQQKHKADLKAKQKGSFTKKFSRDFLCINNGYKNDGIIRYSVKASPLKKY